MGLSQGATFIGHQKGARGRWRKASRRILGFLADAVFLVLAVLLIPVAILAVGTPLALFVRLLLEIAKRM